MGKALSYAGILGTIYVATDEKTQQEISKMMESFNKTTEGITEGMNKINKAMDDLQRISFKLGENNFSLNDLYVGFSNKIASLWNSGEALKVVSSMIMLIIGVISLIISPIVSSVLYIKNGVKDKGNWLNGLRAFLLQIGIEASIGIAFVSLFTRIITL